MTEEARIKAALEWSQKKKCGWPWGEECPRKRVHGDWLCAGHRQEWAGVYLNADQEEIR